MEILARLSQARDEADQLRNLFAEMANEVIVQKVLLDVPKTANHIHTLLTDLQQTRTQILNILSKLSCPHEIRLVRTEKEPFQEPPSQ